MNLQQPQPKRSRKVGEVMGIRLSLFLLVSILSISHTRCFTLNKIPPTTTSTTSIRPPSLQERYHNRYHRPIPQLSTSTRKSSSRWSQQIFLQSSANPAEEEGSEPQQSPPQDIVVAETSKALKRVSWLSWWCQMILTVTSAVILIFAKNVVTGIRDAQVNFLLAGTGIVVSFLSIFWTWGGGARLSRRLMSTKRPTSRIRAANMLRRAIDVGVTLNIIGMFLTLLGAEQTVGVLAIKVLTARPWNNPAAAGGLYGAFEGSLQPLDILVVQANTNALLSHFCSLVSLLYLFRYVKKLDPPSQEEENKGNKKRK